MTEIVLVRHAATAWSGLLAQQIDWDGMTRGVFSSLSYALVLGALAVLLFMLLMNGLAIYLRNRFERRW